MTPEEDREANRRANEARAAEQKAQAEREAEARRVHELGPVTHAHLEQLKAEHRAELDELESRFRLQLEGVRAELDARAPAPPPVVVPEFPPEPIP